MIKTITPQRTNDKYGSGAYQAPRSYGKHNGIDYTVLPASLVLANVCGLVVKLGYMYSDDLSYRYVRIKTPLGYIVRYAYVEPEVELGAKVCKGDILGSVQDIAARYEGITPHIHVDVKDPQGNYIDPETYFKEVN